MCAGHRHGCYGSLQGAVDAAHNGDTVRIEPGTFAGGVTIDKSIDVRGAGSGRTTIRGGGPVVTIGEFDAESEPTVSISGVTITGGVTTSSGFARVQFGDAGVFAFGGGIEVPSSRHFGLGAKVTIRDTVITRNRAVPGSNVESGLDCGKACPFALAGGGGIDSWGPLTLTRTTVTDNISGGPGTSDADAAGVYSQQAGLVVRDSVVANNHAIAPRPYGRFAEGGGITVVSAPFYLGPTGRLARFTMDQSRVSGNSAELTSSFSGDVDQHANSAGVGIGGDDDCTNQPDSNCVEATVRRSKIVGNSLSASNDEGDAIAFGAGMNNDGLLDLGDSEFQGNRVTARALGAHAGAASGDSAGLGMGGQADVIGSTFRHNTVAARAQAGNASAVGAGILAGNAKLNTTLHDSLVTDNHVSAVARHGDVTTGGGGITNYGLLEIGRTRIGHNTASGVGPSGTARGGGVLSTLLPNGPSVAKLRVFDSLITDNSLTATDGIEVTGGGLFSSVPLTLKRTPIAHNSPDQCHGC